MYYIYNDVTFNDAYFVWSHALTMLNNNGMDIF